MDELLDYPNPYKHSAQKGRRQQEPLAQDHIVTPAAAGPMAASAEGAVPLSHPYHDISFVDPDTPFDERRTWAPPNDNNLLSKCWDAFNLAALGPGGAAPPLQGRVKFLKSLDFDGVSWGRTFASHMMDETRKMVNLLSGREGHGKAGPHGGGGVDTGVVPRAWGRTQARAAQGTFN